MWYSSSVFYQIYPFGFCGAPDTNDGVLTNRIGKIESWIPHMKKLGVNALYLCPIFESDAHGYDTRDYRTVDRRLGSNEDFAKACASLHEAGIRVIIDGVFNHVGRRFWAFQDVKEKREASTYKDWFHINFGGDSPYGDGFGYEGWEGHYELVRLNLHNTQVVDYLFECIRGWVEEFDIDGLRLDVAYLLDREFLKKLRCFCKALKPDFFLVGETIHGDYNQLVNSEMLDSCTNYECFKGIYSSFNERNMFEIAYSLNRQFGAESWTLYKGLPLLNFADNHDVTRLASNLHEPRHLEAAYALLFTMPGILSVYYGSEWGAKGEKTQGSDTNLRPCFSEPTENELTQWISNLAAAKKENAALQRGNYRQIYLTNQQFVFCREYEGEKIITALNIDSAPHLANLPLQGNLLDLTSGKRCICNNSLEMPAFSACIYRAE